MKKSKGLFKHLDESSENTYVPTSFTIDDFNTAVKCFEQQHINIPDLAQQMQRIKAIAKYGNNHTIYRIGDWGFISKKFAQDFLDGFIKKTKQQQ